MKVIIEDKLLTNKNARPGKKLHDTRAVVIHWTANTGKGANALANRNYFNNPTTQASAHYIVDSESIIRCIPDNEVAYHVGAKSYTSIGKLLTPHDASSPNYSTVGIEMCVNSDGIFVNTQLLTAQLTAILLVRYHLTVDDIYRHYDITGKNCPQFYLDEEKWNFFKGMVDTYMMADPAVESRVYGIVTTSSSNLNVRSLPDTSSKSVVKYQIPKGHRVEILEEKDGWYRIPYGWISSKYVIKD